MLTLQKAILLAEHGDPDLQIAASSLHGHLVGRLADTSRAWRWMAGHLPPRAHRSFTVTDWVRAAYVVDNSGRYARRVKEHDSCSTE